MKVSVNIPNELIRDQLTSGIETGIGYWCDNIEGWKGYDKFKPKDAIHVREQETGEWHTLDFKKAIELAIERYPRLLDPKQQDAETGDVFIQLAAFGKVLYG